MGDVIAISDCFFSSEQSKEHISALEAGNYGEWKPLAEPIGFDTSNLDNLPRHVLRELTLPEECTYVGVRSALVKSQYSGNYLEAASLMVNPLSLDTHVTCSLRLVFRGTNFSCNARIIFPSPINKPILEFRASPGEENQRKKNELYALLGIEDIMSDSGIGFQLSGSHPSEVTGLENVEAEIPELKLLTQNFRLTC